MLGGEFQLVGRRVLGQHGTATVDDDAAVGWHGVDANAIALRKIGVVAVLDYLQVKQTTEDGEQQQGHDGAGYGDATRENALFQHVVFDA